MEIKFNNKIGSNSFDSFKTGETVKYQTEFERGFLLDIEFDSTVLNYERLGSLSYSSGQGESLPFLPSYFIFRTGDQPEIVTLDHEENTSCQKSQIIKKHVAKFAKTNGLIHKVVIKKDVHKDHLIANLELLYKDVNSAFSEDDILILDTIFQAVDSMSLISLRMLVVNESVVNALLFHKALSADLCKEALEDQTRISKGLLFDDYVRWVEKVMLGNLVVSI